MKVQGDGTAEEILKKFTQRDSRKKIFYFCGGKETDKRLCFGKMPRGERVILEAPITAEKGFLPS